MIIEQVTIDAPKGPMQGYLSRLDTKPRPAVIVLEGVYGFDDEIKRITDQVGSSGYVGLAIDYLRGGEAAKTFNTKDVCEDVAAARDWLNHQPYVEHGKIATWGFGYGGTAAFLASSLAGLAASIAFYGQSIARPIPGTDGKPALDEIEDVRAPLLLVFGGHDEQIGPNEIATIRERLTARHEPFEIEVYPEVGHSFFREDLGTIATRQIADAWGRTQAFLKRSFA
ncbi:MAG TPA: dienelactone hydrolase family protein [Candidatus Elarobacter sp.]|jgi:carboxymethylenebutenolidase|nr:dienelactone hydrolase family protein [Candidatus Elarobacter sp.]